MRSFPTVGRDKRNCWRCRIGYVRLRCPATPRLRQCERHRANGNNRKQEQRAPEKVRPDGGLNLFFHGACTGGNTSWGAHLLPRNAKVRQDFFQATNGGLPLNCYIVKWLHRVRSSRADGISETEGKAAVGSGERAGKRASSNLRFHSASLRYLRDLL